MRCRTRIVSTGFATRLALVAHQPGRVMSLYLARAAAGIESAMRKPHGIGAFASHTPSRPECLRACSPDQDLPCTTQAAIQLTLSRPFNALAEKPVFALADDAAAHKLAPTCRYSGKQCRSRGTKPVSRLGWSSRPKAALSVACGRCRRNGSCPRMS